MSVTPPLEIISRIKQKQLQNLIEEGKRLDGRSLFEYRPIKIERGVIEKADGSALVTLGSTKVLAGIKVDIVEPFKDTPDEGVIIVNAELVPLASPTFEPGPPNEFAIELARVVDRGIRESGAIDLKKLCIIEGKKVFAIYIDIYVLNDGGNLIDASALAAVSALMTATLPKVEVDENNNVVAKEGREPLVLQNIPITVSLAKIGDKLFVDPSSVEESVIDTKITITVDQNGNICSIQKSGCGSLPTKQIKNIIEIVREKAKKLREIITSD